MSGNGQFEREFESFLKEDDSKLAALYRKLPRPEPDAKLDAAVLAMARRAAAATPYHRARTPRWIPALSAAAVLALAVGVAYRVGPQVWEQRSSPSLQKPANENAVSAPAPGAAEKEATQRDKADAFQDLDTTHIVPKPMPAAPAPAAPLRVQPAAPVGYAARDEKKQEVLRKAETAKRADLPAPQAFPRQAENQQKLKSTTADDAVSAQGAGNAAPYSDSVEHAPASTSAREEPVAAPPPQPAETREMGSTVQATPPPPAASSAPEAAAGGASESLLTAPAPGAQAAKTAAPRVRSKDANANLYPEHWLANIRTMLREHKRDEALRSLAEFRKMYPDYHLPDDLRDLK